MAYEPFIWFENQSTSDSFTNISADANDDQNSPNTDEIENPARVEGIVAAFAGSGTGSGSIEEARLDIPSLREPSDPYIGQVHDSAVPGDWPYPLLDLRDMPLDPGQFERMKVEVQGADGGTAEDYMVALLAQVRSGQSIPSGPRRRIQFTGDGGAPTADSWNREGITLDQTLQNGNYAVIGGQVRHSDQGFWGFDFRGQEGFVGGPLVSDEHSNDFPWTQPGATGDSWGEFRDEAPPDVVYWTTGTTDDMEGHIDVVGPLGTGGA